jgi:hypothetical protein
MTMVIVLYLVVCAHRISAYGFTGLLTKTNFHLKRVKSGVLISSHIYFLISVQFWKLKGWYVYSVNCTYFFLPPYSYQESALQALHSAKDQLQSEKDACEHKITDLRYFLDEKSSKLTQYSENIAAMTDNLQKNEKRLGELEIENKSLEGKFREKTTVIDHLQTDLTATELKLRDSISKVSDLCAEVEEKTAKGLELKAVSVFFTLPLIVIY